MPNENKDMEKLDQALKNMPKPQLTDRQIKKISQTIMQSNKQVPYKKYSAILGGITALFVFSFLIFTANNNYQSGLTSDEILENIITKAGSEYRFENIPWFITQQEVQRNIELPSGAESGVYADDDQRWSENIIPKDVTFSNTGIEAGVIVKYKFYNDLFIGGEYIIELETVEDLITISMELRDYLDKKFPNPSVNSLESLSEKSIQNSNSIGVEWWEGEDNIDFSSFRIDVLNQADHDTYAISIRVDAAQSKAEDILERKVGAHPLQTDTDLISALQDALDTENKVTINEFTMLAENNFFGYFTMHSDPIQQGVFYGNEIIPSEGIDIWNIENVDFLKK